MATAEALPDVTEAPNENTPSSSSTVVAATESGVANETEITNDCAPTATDKDLTEVKDVTDAAAEAPTETAPVARAAPKTAQPRKIHESVDEWLDDIELSDYKQCFKNQGYEKLDDLRVLGRSEDDVVNSMISVCKTLVPNGNLSKHKHCALLMLSLRKLGEESMAQYAHLDVIMAPSHIPDVAASIPAESSGNGSTDSGGAADDVPNGASGDVNGASGDANDASSDANGASSDANGEPKTNAGATTAVPRGGSVASGKSSTKKAGKTFIAGKYRLSDHHGLRVKPANTGRWLGSTWKSAKQAYQKGRCNAEGCMQTTRTYCKCSKGNPLCTLHFAEHLYASGAWLRPPPGTSVVPGTSSASAANPELGTGLEPVAMAVDTDETIAAEATTNAAPAADESAHRTSVPATEENTHTLMDTNIEESAETMPVSTADADSHLPVAAEDAVADTVTVPAITTDIATAALELVSEPGSIAPALGANEGEEAPAAMGTILTSTGDEATVLSTRASAQVSAVDEGTREHG